MIPSNICFSQNTPIYLEQISFSLQARLSKYTKIKLVAVQVSITKLCLEIQVEIGQDSQEIEKANIVEAMRIFLIPGPAAGEIMVRAIIFAHLESQETQ